MTSQGKAMPRSEGQPRPAAPSISLPKGGGAIRGIGEKFAANPVTGTGSMSLPIGTSPGRSGLTPQLSLSYDSGSGNGPFGFGWNLSLPAIARKTDKGLPQYLDGDDSDVFILSGAEDLVPELKKDAAGNWSIEDGKHVFFDDPRPVDGVTYSVRRYRPRTEGLFARIERWTNTENGEVHWRSISASNVTTLYGHTKESRIADPADIRRVFSWLICESYDDKGNAIVYDYAAENSAGIDLLQTHERNRNQDTRSVNCYLKRIRYGNLPSRLVQPDLAQMDWLFEVVLDYGEGHVQPLPSGSEGQELVTAAKDADPAAWPVRQDAFSGYRAGFEVRTYRLCRRVLMFHHFQNELGTPDCLVGSTDFTYDEGPIGSFLTRIVQSGYVLQSNGAYLRKSLPPVELEYSKAQLSTEVVAIDAPSLEHLPAGLDNARNQSLDLDGEGLPGVLTEQASGWFYKRNVSPLAGPGQGAGDSPAARFDPAQVMERRPSVAALAAARQQFLGLAGDGQVDLVQFGGGLTGYHERTQDDDWAPFVALSSMPNVDVDDPNARFIDLTGDGHADLLLAGEGVFAWYPSLAKAGFADARRVHQALDEEKGPRLVFADGTESIYLADLSGDGLTDLVRIRNGEVCYWPNLGYGRFGAKVTMDAAPRFDAADLFEQRRIRLGDIDGSGTTDIFYLGSDQITIWRNESGNRWSTPIRLTDFPRTDTLSSVMVLDLLGNGTACLVWSSPLPGETLPMRYIDLMGGQKPHLLIAVRNNLGAETRVHYTPSTRFYLADKLAGKPWITRLPFPVHVVDRVETYDHVSRNRFVTRHAYHHGYFDGPEREFRGFGMVEQQDTEELAALSPGGALSEAANLDAASHVPPVLTRTWFHTGGYLEGSRISRQFEDEYYRESEGLLLDDTLLPSDLTSEEAREACRALKGSMLRQEVYALDYTEEADRPYRVSERNYTLKGLQPRAENRHAVFFAHPREALELHYERKLYETGAGKRADPRVSHAVTLDVDDYGNVLLSAAIGYGRRFDDPDPALTVEDRKKQRKRHVTFTVNAVTEAVLEPDDHRTPLLCESRTFELLNAEPSSGVAGATILFGFKELGDLMAQAGDGQHEIPYEDVAGVGASGSAAHRRLLEHTRTFYRRDDLTALLSLKELQSRGLPGESLTLALTPGLLNQVFVAAGKATLPELAGMLEDKSAGGYVHSQGDVNWWIPSGRVFYSVDPADTPQQELALAHEHFFLPSRIEDPFGNAATILYDGYHLLPSQTKDALQNTVLATYDYRVLQARLVTDANGNQSEAAFDALGMVVGTAIMGKANETLGDTLKGFVPDIGEPMVLKHVDQPLAEPHALLQGATTRLVYDLFAYQRTKNDPQPHPAVVYMMARETHVSDLAPNEQARVQHSFSYSDGFGREIQRKIQAEPGPLEEGGLEVSPRWVGSGWTIFNNKGKPVRQYEPFFSATHRFQFAHAVGVSPVLFYDPLERVVATLHPDHTWEKVVFDPWRQEAWDGNDTALIPDPKMDGDAGVYFDRLAKSDYLPTWHASRIGGAPEEQDAAKKVEAHAGTPAVTHLDTLGRPFLGIADNSATGKYRTLTELDIEGNQLAVVDSLKRVVMRYDYALAGTRLHSASMEAGARWMLHDVGEQPIAGWDSRGHGLRHSYDALRRPTEIWLLQNGLPKRLVQRTVYGEPQGKALNHRTRVYQVFDGSGVATSDEYDFKGNPARGSRQLAADYKGALDWSGNVPLEQNLFRTASEFDALNRATAVTTPDESVFRPTYNEANLLERLKANLRGSSLESVFVENIEYNAKGQRRMIAYGNGVISEGVYDERTFLLRRLHTVHAGKALQDLRYTYDPVGNITAIADHAQQTVYFSNAVVSADAAYVYDALYRLVEATGREHIGQLSVPQTTWKDEFRIRLPHPNDGQAIRRYTEHFDYDPAGNIVALVHSAPNGDWTRTSTFEETSQLEAGKTSTRLSTTAVGSLPEGTYTYDAHGNMASMPHLPLMRWDYLDRLIASSQQVVQSGTPETTYYVYDGAGQRVRKVTEHAAAPGVTPTRKSERIYLGGFEVYREYGSGGEVELRRESLHIMDGESRVALVETQVTATPSALVRYQLGNHLGSAALELDHEGRIISYEESYPYGSTSYQSGRSLAEVSLKRYRYTGKERDEETGLNYHGARYYAPWLGRWMSIDPGGFADGTNSYAYSRNSPVGLLDSSGRQAEQARELLTKIRHGESEVKRLHGLLSKGGYTAEEHEAIESTIVSAQTDLQALREQAGSFVVEVLRQQREAKRRQAEEISKMPAAGNLSAAEYERGVEARRRIEQAPARVRKDLSNLTSSPLGLATATYLGGRALTDDPEKVSSFIELGAAAGGVVGAVGSAAPIVPPGSGQAPRDKVEQRPLPEQQSAPPVPESRPVPPSSLPTPPGGKTVATTPGGPITLSGWGAASQIPGRESPVAQVYEYSRSAGHPLRPHFRDYPRTPGSYVASHAELQAYILNPGAASVTVSKIPCLGCQTWFRAEATQTGTRITVHSPTQGGPGTWVFTPQGTMWITAF